MLNMNLLRWTLCLLFISTLSIQAQDCLNKPNPFVSLDDCVVGETRTIRVRLFNNSNNTVYISGVEYINPYLYTVVEAKCLTPKLTLAPSTDDSIVFQLTPRHNILFKGYIVFQALCNCSTANYTVFVNGRSHYADSSYNYTEDLEYDSLYSALQQKLIAHTSLGYKSAREVMFGKADNVNDSVECIYTGRKLKTAGIPPNGEFNTEHTWVQSRGSDKEPNKSDINHLYPTYPNANTIRSNYPFGNVAKLWRDAGGGSRLGFTVAGDTVFEPRDVSKGNIARSIFYYLVRYGNLTNYYLQPYNMDATLRAWNAADPPDKRERERCDTIAAYQGKRNPFVDHPELAERIDFVSMLHSDAARLSLRRFIINPDENTTINTSFVNKWKDTLLLRGFYVNNSDFQINATLDMPLAPHGNTGVRIQYTKGLSSLPARTYLYFSFSSGGSDTLIIENCSLASRQDEAENLLPASGIRIAPHPVEDYATVECAVRNEDVLRVALFSTEGRELADLTNRVQATTNGILLNLERKDAELYGKVVMLRIITLRGVLSSVVLMN